MIIFFIEIQRFSYIFQFQRGIPTVPSSVKLTRIEENFNINDFHLKTEDMSSIHNLNKSHPIIGERVYERKIQYSHSPHYPFHDEI